MSYNHKLITEYQDKLEELKAANNHYEPLGSVVVLHLYVEYCINYLIENHCQNSKRLLDHSNVTFSIKLEIVFALGLIPEWLYINIRKLNKIRNGYSHNLDFDLLNSDLQFNTLDDADEVIIEDYSKLHADEGNDIQRHNILVLYLPFSTIFPLDRHIINKGL